MSLPPAVLIPAGKSFASFYVGAINNTLVDGTRTVTLSAFVANAAGTGKLAEAPPVQLSVTDDDGPMLRLVLGGSVIREGRSATSSVSRNTPTDQPLTVNLISSDETVATVPASVVIPAGSAATTFAVTSVPDGLPNGNRRAIITASLAGFAPASAAITITDFDLPDLAVSEVTLPDSALTGEKVPAHFRVTNTGSATAHGPFTQRVVLSRDEALDAGDVELARVTHSGDLAQGQSFVEELVVPMPREAGDYRIFVVADTDDVIRETLENNNTALASVVIRVAPAYTASVTSDVNAAPAGTVVPLRGRAVRPGGEPAAFEPVSIHLRVRGAERVLATVTDAAGNFATEFRPVALEAGRYEFGATHPGVSGFAVQGEFRLLGFRISPGGASHRLTALSSVSGEALLENITDLPLTDLKATVVGVGTSIRVAASIPSTLVGGGSVKLAYTITSVEDGGVFGSFTLRLSTAEGFGFDFPVSFGVDPLRPQLEVFPRRLDVGMVRGRQQLIDITLVNSGGAPTGPLHIALPEAAWMRVASANPIPELKPGETAHATLQLTPPASLPLGPFTGSFAVIGGQVAVTIPFSLNHVSDAVGDLKITAADELSYYGDDKKGLVGAAVILRSPFTSEVLWRGETKADGTATFAGVPEGSYDLEVSASGHDSYFARFELAPGQVNEKLAFLRTQFVRYRWIVEPIEIEERTKITLESVFETSVPVPVLIVEPAVIDLDGIVGDEQTVELKISNHGQIAAQDVQMNFEHHGNWAVTPLLDNLGSVPPEGSITVPVLFRRVPPDGGEGGAPNDCRKSFSGGVSHTLPCGDLDVTQGTPIALIHASKDCPESHAPIISGRCELCNLELPVLTVPVRVGSGNEGQVMCLDCARRFEIGLSTIRPTLQKTNSCACTPETFKEVCKEKEFGSLKLSVEGLLKEAISKALPPWAIFDGAEVKLDAKGKACSCCSEGSPGFYGELSAGFDAKVTFFFGVRAEIEETVPVAGWREVTVKAGGQIGASLEASAKVRAAIRNKCHHFFDIDTCLDFEFAANLTPQAKIGASVEAVTSDGTKFEGNVETILSLDLGISLKGKACRKGGLSYEMCAEPVVATFKSGGELSAKDSVNPKLKQKREFGVTLQKTLFEKICKTQKAVKMSDRLFARLEAAAGEDSEVSTFGNAAAVHAADPSNQRLRMEPFLAPEYRNPPALASVTAAATEEASLPTKTTFTSTSRPASARESIFASKAGPVARSSGKPRLAGADDGSVCAQVRLKIEQEAVVTRKAIGATLELDNLSTSLSLENVGVSLEIFDAEGHSVTEKFAILKPELTDLVVSNDPEATPDGAAFFTSGQLWHLSPNKTGRARWVILPRDEAAVNGPTQYFVGGHFNYNAGETSGGAEFVPAAITVYPNAKLTLKYFHQRDVFSDDPFTSEVEPALPFTLAVLVENSGRGVAKNFSITSAQPTIVENYKGLTIGFDIVATEVASARQTPSLTAAFGDINPGEIKIGRWLLKSPLQGLFVDYNAKFEADDRFGDKSLSTIQSVEIHELIRQVEARGAQADGKPDFLVNDVPDDEDLPDTIYLSDGRILPVNAVTSVVSAGTPNADNLEVTLTAAMPPGWSYLRVPEPGDGHFHLVQVRRSDGLDLGVDVNAWTTDRTFIGLSRPPRREHRLHLVDFDSTGSYTLVYQRDTATPDTTAPTSAMIPLPATSPSQIPLIWTGADDAVGTGIASYDVWVSVDDAAFAPWRTDVRGNSALYSAAAGHRYAFYTVAHDRAGNVEAAPSTPDAMTVTTGNTPPNLTPIADVSLDEGQAMEVNAIATDADLPGDRISYSLVAAPPSMAIGAVSGRITWTTTEADGPGRYPVTVRATDNGTPPASSDRTFIVTVREVNAAPTLLPPGTLFTVNEGEPLSIIVDATDPDRPANPLRFRLGATAPDGMTINAVSGLLGWTPPETAGGSVFTFDVLVNDGGSPDLGDTKSLTVRVVDVNSAPVLTRIKPQTVIEGDTLTVATVAKDTDVPVQTLTFSLEPATPGATVGVTSGVFTWTPDETQAGTTNQFTLTVTDDGVPPLTASQSFVVVVRPLTPGLNYPKRLANGDVNFHFKGEVGAHYVLEASTDLNAWTTLREFPAERRSFVLTDQTSAALRARYFRARKVE